MRGRNINRRGEPINLELGGVDVFAVDPGEELPGVRVLLEEPGK